MFERRKEVVTRNVPLNLCKRINSDFSPKEGRNQAILSIGKKGKWPTKTAVTGFKIKALGFISCYVEKFGQSNKTF